jgi:leucyl aminopeptidase
MLKSVTLGEFDAPNALIVGKFQDSDLDKSTAKLDANGAIAAAIARPEFTGASGSLVEAFIPTPTAKGADKPATGTVRVLVVGLGKAKAFKTGDLRSAIAPAARRLATTKDAKVQINLADALGSIDAKLDLRHAGRSAGEAFGLLSWDHLAFKGKGTDKKDRPAITVQAKGGQFAKGFETGLALADAANLCRTLSETPPNIATPAFMAEQARKLGKHLGLKVTVIEGKDLEKEKLVGLINVGKASENKPCMIRIEYRPDNAKKDAKPLVLIGKTMTYDTGGLSLKINNGMVGMKRDKDGGCAVLGAMHAIAATIKPKFPVVALLCAAENSISDEAYRPDDVLTYRNGVTVEITNTDAEGRLVLADGLCWACEKESPRAIVDLATLTGGVVVALGSTYCGMFCDDDKLRAAVNSAADSSGERVWQLPMHSEYRDLMKSPIADILNSNPNRKAHPIQGAAFLSYFVDGYTENKIPWCHLDIAGVHATESDSGPFVKGPTGWGVRLLADLVDQM